MIVRIHRKDKALEISLQHPPLELFPQFRKLVKYQLIIKPPMYYRSFPKWTMFRVLKLLFPI